MKIETAEQARALLANYLGWPLECVPVPKKDTGGNWIFWDRTPSAPIVTWSGFPSAPYWLPLVFMMKDALPTPAQVVAQRDTRIEELEAEVARLKKAITIYGRSVGSPEMTARISGEIPDDPSDDNEYGG